MGMYSKEHFRLSIRASVRNQADSCRAPTASLYERRFCSILPGFGRGIPLCVLRCTIWKPSVQFDQLPAANWPWPSFHSPPLNGTDGQPNVCHRGPGYGVTQRNATLDLGLGAEGEVGCARCGAHLG